MAAGAQLALSFLVSLGPHETVPTHTLEGSASFSETSAKPLLPRGVSPSDSKSRQVDAEDNCHTASWHPLRLGVCEDELGRDQHLNWRTESRGLP